MSAATLEPKTVTATVAPRDCGAQVKAPLSPADQFERYDTIDTPRIVVIGFVAAILTFVVILSAQAVFFAADKAEVQKKEVAIADTPHLRCSSRSSRTASPPTAGSIPPRESSASRSPKR